MAQNEYDKVVAGNGGAVNPANIALQFRQALRPWGFSFLGIDGGTDEDTLYYLAGVCRGNVWSEVTASYRTLYKSELIQDISDDANPKFSPSL
ncbi:hypothetical protein [Salmonirosea aquatica]|uniref:Uncharacterized protein n=1 Tax=Salmonirosea aquatica TaxID=2654236 RepID=A0A7C9F6V9_9BACT|nr:hypothetical protein [Cytophagaceae bacterium SJW1-29]